MEEGNKFKLIDGVFETRDAKEILLSLIGHKIQYHNTRIFGDLERYGISDEHSVTRVEQLKQTRKQIVQLIEECEKSSKQLVLRAIISIEPLK
jgi:hypothetical protein